MSKSTRSAFVRHTGFEDCSSLSKIQLPEHSVSITIDDGWYVSRAITILEKYQILGTLFLIGSLKK